MTLIYHWLLHRQSYLEIFFKKLCRIAPSLNQSTTPCQTGIDVGDDHVLRRCMQRRKRITGFSTATSLRIYIRKEKP